MPPARQQVNESMIEIHKGIELVTINMRTPVIAPQTYAASILKSGIFMSEIEQYEPRIKGK